MSRRPRISKPEDIHVIAESVRRAIHQTPINKELRRRMKAELKDRIDSSSIYELAATKMIEAQEFRAALVALATISSENESMLIALSDTNAELASLFKQELRERTFDLVGLRRTASERGTKAVNALHDKPGGYREKRRKVVQEWETGRYKTKTACAMAAQGKLGISYSTAMKALRTPRKKGAATT